MKNIKYNNLKDWYDIYVEQINKNGGNKQYMNLKIAQKKKLINIILKNSNSGKILEIGSGTGIVCSALANQYNKDVSGVDNNEEIIKLAKKLEKEFFNANKVKYYNMDMFNLGNFAKKEFSMCYSVGVLEHYEDEKIIKEIEEEKRISEKIIIVIPTKWFDDDETLHGDDRFLTIKYWRKLIDKSGCKIIKEYSYPFKQNFYQKINNIRKIFRPKAYRIFLIEEKEN